MSPERDDASEKVAPNPKRTTFLACREIIDQMRHAVERTRAAQRSLAVDSSPRTRLFHQSLESLQRELSKDLDRFERTIPPALLDEENQYTQEMSAELADPDPPASPDEALALSLTLTRSLRGRLRELAESASSRELREAYANLGEAVAGTERRIVRLEEGEHDL